MYSMCVELWLAFLKMIYLKASRCGSLYFYCYNSKNLYNTLNLNPIKHAKSKSYILTDIKLLFFEGCMSDSMVSLKNKLFEKNLIE